MNFNDDSSSDEEDFFGLPKGFSGVVEECDYRDVSSVVLDARTSKLLNHLIDILLLRNYEVAIAYCKQIERIFESSAHTKKYVNVCLNVIKLLNGQYLELILQQTGASSLSYYNLMSCMNFNLDNEKIDIANISDFVLRYIAGCENDQDDNVLSIDIQLRALDSVILGLAYMELFCQMNYTGPELSTAELKMFKELPQKPVTCAKSTSASEQNSFSISTADSDKLELKFHNECIRLLEVDGDYPYYIVEIPITLVMARCILTCVSGQGMYALWNKGIQIDASSKENKFNIDRTAGEDLFLTLMAKPTYAAEGVLIPTTTSIQILKKILFVFEAPFGWFCARSVMVHLRLIMYVSFSNSGGAASRANAGSDVAMERLPTLWIEAQTVYASVLKTYGNLCGHRFKYTINNVECADYINVAETETETEGAVYKPFSDAIFDVQSMNMFVLSPIANAQHNPEVISSALAIATVEAQLWLEFGLSHVYFDVERKGKMYFSHAKKSAGLEASLTGALGKKTKYQVKDFAQLYVETSSSLVKMMVEMNSKSGMSTGTNGNVDGEVIPAMESEAIADPNLKEVETMTMEIGKHVISADEKGDEIAMRNVKLDHVEGATVGGYDENILFEEGVRYQDSSVNSGNKAKLHHIDEAILLALCLDVENSNPKDGLTNEEMKPYIQKVLNNNVIYANSHLKYSRNKDRLKAEESAEAARAIGETEEDLSLALPPSNWMIFSTALLQRSWVEFEKRRTTDRAMLQIQALIDQHTTKLTMMQSTRASVVEESAPVQDRIKYLFCIVYPAQYELKADLARRYLQCSVVSSALAYFRELQMWDDVVTCYQLLEKPYRAELVVRERLEIAGETPYMLTALGDLTNNVEYYEKAWQVSGKRYARAKRTMARLHYDKGEYREAVAHYRDALLVQPIMPSCWYLVGIASMRSEDLHGAIEAFVRCIEQQTEEEEYPEAYANLGAIYTRTNDYNKAYSAFSEAYRLKRENWKIVENLMLVSLVLGKYHECMQHMKRLVELRHASKRPLHIEELRRLGYLISHDQVSVWKKQVEDMKTASGNGEISEEIKKAHPFVYTSNYKNFLGLLQTITNAIKSNADVWEVFAEAEYTIGQYYSSRENRLKQIRALFVDYDEAVSCKTIETTVDIIDKFVVCVEFLVEIQLLSLSSSTIPVNGTVVSNKEIVSVINSIIAKLSVENATDTGSKKTEAVEKLQNLCNALL